MYNRVNWPVRELYSMWSGSEKINNFKTYCDFWRELEERGTFSKPIPQKHHLDYVDKCKSPISSFLFQPVLPEELSEILLVPNDKSDGLYSSPTKLLKCSSAVTAPVLSGILNTSIRLGTYPSKLKIAKITPMIQMQTTTDLSLYF